MRNWSSKVNAPFKPLNIKRPGSTSSTAESVSKLRKLDDVKPTKSKDHLSRISSIPSDDNVVDGVPLKESNKHSPPKYETSVTKSSLRKTYSVLFRKKTTKKNKTWDGDGNVIFYDGYLTLKDLKGKLLAKTSRKEPPNEGELISIGSYEVEIQFMLSEDQVKAQASDGPKKPGLIKPVSSHDPSIASLLSRNGTSRPSGHTSDTPGSAVSAEDFYGQRSGGRSAINTKPKYDPNAPDAVVLTRPPGRRTPVIDVVIDPLIAKKLRPHQKEGVKFLYECIMGFRDYGGQGALLADDMGLGKTLTTITLLWTILKQNPEPMKTPIARRVLIVCPVTLIANWKAEFNKWLGADRLGVFVMESNADFKRFLSSHVYQVMIIGYEKVRALSDELQAASFDLIVCDEGHRLKTTTNKSLQVLQSLDTPSRIILSGTPIQNDLSEFRTMADFLNPGILGKESVFKRKFEIPIIRSRQPGALPKDISDGNECLTELYEITKQFVLRRSAAELASFLPPKTETVLFCSPSVVQKYMYANLLDSKEITSALGSSDSMVHLKAIIMLRKVCNSPLLLESSETTKILQKNDSNLPLGEITSSGKAKVLKAFLNVLFSTTKEKVVIVSGYTQTLDFIEKIMHKVKGSPNFFRLDGSTPQRQRQKLVDEFNNSTSEQVFAFLLSAKSGGTGLNLIGASRLFLFDTDWNPSVDQQSMARIHRDGQKRPVYIYRLLLTGCIDEKIYQRQATKLGLADKFMDGQDQEGTQKGNSSKGSTDTFTYSELRDLFSINTETRCNTHDLLECDCPSSREKQNQHQISKTIESLRNGHQKVSDTAVQIKLEDVEEILESDIEEETIQSDEEEEDGEGPGEIEVSAQTCDNKVLEDEEVTDEDEPSTSPRGWITASDIALGNVKMASELKPKEKMSGLFDYQHILPSNYLNSGSDTILREVLTKNTISFIFTKTGTVSNQSSKI